MRFSPSTPTHHNSTHTHTNASSIVLLCVEHSKRRNILPSIVRSSVFYPLCGIITLPLHVTQWNWVERFTTAHPEKQKPLDIWHESFLFILSLSVLRIKYSGKKALLNRKKSHYREKKRAKGWRQEQSWATYNNPANHILL